MYIGPHFFTFLLFTFPFSFFFLSPATRRQPCPRNEWQGKITKPLRAVGTCRSVRSVSVAPSDWTKPLRASCAGRSKRFAPIAPSNLVEFFGAGWRKVPEVFLRKPVRRSSLPPITVSSLSGSFFPHFLSRGPMFTIFTVHKPTFTLRHSIVCS